MSVYRIVKQDNFAIMDKHLFEDPNLSLEAKGLLGYLLTKPNDWVVRAKDIYNHCTNGRDKVYKVLKELQEKGYIVKLQHKDEKNQFTGVEYQVYERPQPVQNGDSSPLPENQDTGKKPFTGFQDTGIPDTGHQYITNNNATNNDISNGWLGKTPTSSQNTTQADPLSSENPKQEWELVKGTCGKYDLPPTQAVEFYKVWRHYYSDAPITIVLATIRELMNDKVVIKRGKWSEQEYSNITGLFHHRMKVWREMAVVYEDIDGIAL